MNGPTFATAPSATAVMRPPARPTASSKAAPKLDPDAGNGLRIFTYLRLHWLMILFCGTLLGSCGAYAAWELMPSKYESYALLQVSAVPYNLASQSNPEARTDFVTYMKTTAGLIKSDFVLNAALRDIKDLPTIKEQKEPIKFLDEEVIAAPVDGSELIRLGFKGHNPADAKKIVDSLVHAFLVEVIQKEAVRNREFIAKSEGARDNMFNELSKLAEQPKTAQGAIGVPGGPLPVPGAAAPGVIQQAVGVLPPALPAMNPTDLLMKHDPRILVGRVDRLQNDVEALPLQIDTVKREMKKILDRHEALKKAPVDQKTLAEVDRDPEVYHQATRVAQARGRHDLYANIGDPMAPTVVNLGKMLQAEEAALVKVRQEKLTALEGGRRLEEEKKLMAEWEHWKSDLERLEMRLAVGQAQLAQAAKHLQELPIPTDKAGGGVGGGGRHEDVYDPSKTSLMTTDGVFSRVVSQYLTRKLELSSPPRVQSVQPASNPMQKDTRKQVLGTVFAGLMGYALVAIAVIGFETVSRRVSSLGDLKSAGPAPVVGVIPCQPAEATGRDPIKRAAANEAMDKLRAYVSQSWLARGAATVAVTSPLGDEGKAFTAFGLASSLAQAGYKTLLADFDLREPALHHLAGVPNQVGVCEALRGEADLLSAIQLLPSGLQLLTAGKWSDEMRKTAVGGKLESLLARIKEPYDCVVLHSHALLTTAESVEVARLCEVVLVCAQYRETKVPFLKRATDRLAAMEVPYSGVVYVGATEQEALC